MATIVSIRAKREAKRPIISAIPNPMIQCTVFSTRWFAMQATIRKSITYASFIIEWFTDPPTLLFAKLRKKY